METVNEYKLFSYLRMKKDHTSLQADEQECEYGKYPMAAFGCKELDSLALHRISEYESLALT